MTGTKRCTGCGQVKPLDQFHRDRTQSDGHVFRCKICQNAARRHRYAANPEKEREAARAYREANPEKHREAVRAYGEANPEKERERFRRYRKANPEKVREWNRRAYAVNPEPTAKRTRRYNQIVRGKVLAHYGTSCACCGTTEDLTIDHIDGNGREHRAEVGGSGVYLWLIRQGFPEGYQTLCRPCNTSKGRGSRCILDHARPSQVDAVRHDDRRPTGRAVSDRRRQNDRERSSRYRADLRGKVLAHYGTSCSCCGTTERLTIDHINGDGSEHRAELGKVNFYRWLIRQGFPEGYQVLCFPCNQSKGRGSRCGLDHAAAALAAAQYGTLIVPVPRTGAMGGGDAEGG